MLFSYSGSFINDRFYKQSGPCGTTNPGLSINNRFYMQFLYPELHRRGRRRLEKVVFFKSPFLHITGETKISFSMLAQLQRLLFSQKVLFFRSSKPDFITILISCYNLLTKNIILKNQEQHKNVLYTKNVL